MNGKRIVIASLIACMLAGTAIVAGDYAVKDKKNKQTGEPTEDMALVYVIRPSNLGAAIKFWVFADDQVIGMTRGKSYAFALVPEGSHLFWAKAENTSTLEMEVVGGRTYYLKTVPRMGFGKARVNLSMATEADLQKVLAKGGYMTLTEAGKRRAAEIAANRMERAETKEAKKDKYEGD
jgi:hypothetical protein